ncbi:MAG: ATP synthase F1 subunit gamma [Verrucomicrobiales bacterium]
MANNTREIRRRIKSVKSTAQITKAMQMVASSKMRKAQQAALASRPFANQLHRLLVGIRGSTSSQAHPLLQERELKKELVLVISTDKGLCGPLNTNLFRELLRFDPAQTDFVVLGNKARQTLMRLQRNIVADFPLKDSPSFREVRQISKHLQEAFLNGRCDKVTVLYTHFKNTLSQIPTVTTLLPISSAQLPGADEAELEADGVQEYLFEPGRDQILSSLLPHYVDFIVYGLVLDARASEHSARMVAMKNATDNAKELIKSLTLEYNKVRQASITAEILEISSAQMAME